RWRRSSATPSAARSACVRSPSAPRSNACCSATSRSSRGSVSKAASSRRGPRLASSRRRIARRSGCAEGSGRRSSSDRSAQKGAWYRPPMQEEEAPRVTLRQLLKVMHDRGASDLHITTGSPLQLRIDGSLVPLRTPPLTPLESKALCYEAMTEEQKAKFEKHRVLDFSFGVKGLSRFRANCFLQRGAVGGAIRVIPFKIRPIDELGLPPVVNSFAHLPRGLVLVTGPTGSGKSTTLASLIDKVNSERRDHIMTVEDPIEFLHPNKSCIVNQREVGQDTHSFQDALKH